MKTTKLGTHIGVVVEGYRLDPADEEMPSLVHALLAEHKAVFFKGQHMSARRHLGVAKSLGATEVHPFISEEDPVVQGISPYQPHPDIPEIMGIYHDESHTGNLNAWHSDLCWRAKPTYLSVLKGVKIPPRGGDTCFADMGAAYRTLPEKTRAELDGLRVVHDWLQIYREAFDGRPDLLAQMREKYPAQTHRLVLTHPVTKEKSLFSNKVSGVRVEGVCDEESARILDLVHRRAWLPEFQCRFRWEDGDVAIWDNLATQHYAVSDYWPHERKVERITLAGFDLTAC